MQESQIWCVDSSWDGGVVPTILGHFDLDIDFWPHFQVYRVWSISPRLQLTFLKSVLCLTNSFGGIRHVTVTFLVEILECLLYVFIESGKILFKTAI